MIWLLLLGCRPDAVCAPDGRLCTAAGVLGRLGFDGDGDADEHLLFFPSALAMDGDRVVVDDFNNMRIRALADGGLETLAGSGVHAYAMEGVAPLETPMENPVDIALAGGVLYVSELHAGRVLRIDEHVTVVAGGPEIGFSGDGGPATEARLSEAWGIAVADDGTLYIADTDNHVIRVVEHGVIRTLAGTPQVPGFVDGLPGAFDTPYRVRVDGDRLLVADTDNHAIRAVDRLTGEVTTLVGDGTPGHDGDGGAATLAHLDGPYGVEPTGDGGFLVADSGNHVVRWVDASGFIYGIAGTGARGAGGDGGPCDEADLDTPAHAVPDGAGGVYIADMLNGAVRHVGGVLP